MLKKAMITAAMGAAIVGGGTAALASSGEHVTNPAAGAAATAPSTTGAPTKTTPAKTKPSAKTKQQRQAARRVHLGRALHATWVTKDGKTKAVVTHDAIHGTVSGVTSTSITIKAADGYSERFTVSGSTKVRMRVAGQAKGTTSSISNVKVGAKVLVIGTGKGTPTATRVVAGLKR